MVDKGPTMKQNQLDASNKPGRSVQQGLVKCVDIVLILGISDKKSTAKTLINPAYSQIFPNHVPITAVPDLGEVCLIETGKMELCTLHVSVGQIG